MPYLGIIPAGGALLMSPIPETDPEVHTGIVFDLHLLLPKGLKALSVKDGFCSDLSS